MNKVKLITDSCCSLSEEELEKLGVDFVQMSITVDKEEAPAFEFPIKKQIKNKKKLKQAESCKTSCVNVQSFLDVFHKYVDQGFDVVYVGLSSGLSCTYNNAILAADEINSGKGQRVWVADSLSGSFAIAIMLEKAAKLISEGKTAEEVFEAINKNGMKTYTLFIPTDLNFLLKCGRLSKLAASIGSLLKLEPVLTADGEGKLKTVAKGIGKRRTMKILENLLLENADMSTQERIYIGHTGQEQEAMEVKEFLEANTTNKEIIVGWIDYTMGCCCGPETLAIFMTGKK